MTLVQSVQVRQVLVYVREAQLSIYRCCERNFGIFVDDQEINCNSGFHLRPFSILEWKKLLSVVTS